MGLLSRNKPNETAMTKDFTVLNPQGLHARPSALFVKTANLFKSEVWVEKDGEQINGKSIMGLMMLAAGQGSRLRVTCEGPDAEEALAAIEAIILRRFGDEP